MGSRSPTRRRCRARGADGPIPGGPAPAGHRPAAGRLRARHRAPRPAHRRPHRSTGPRDRAAHGHGPQGGRAVRGQGPRGPRPAGRGGRRDRLLQPASLPGCTRGIWSSPRRPATRTAPRRAPATELLVKELIRAVPGRTVHTGPLTGSDHVVRGHERGDLLATGAIAVDMESASTLRTAAARGPRPVAAVRVVVDAPEHELVRISTVRGGISAFRVLRAVLPAFFEWHRSLLLPRR